LESKKYSRVKDINRTMQRLKNSNQITALLVTSDYTLALFFVNIWYWRRIELARV